MIKILVYEDDEAVRSELAALLSANGYEVVDEPPCDLALCDVNMPGDNGYERCRKLKMNYRVPVIFLTARDRAEDEIVGFAVGGDDYIRKPYNSSVLLMRIARLVNRPADDLLTVRELRLDLGNLRVLFHNQSVELTKNEARILACMMKKPLCSKQEIIEELWDNSLYIDENTLYVNINRLREKLKSLGADDYIRTVRGVGYRL